MKFVRHMLVAVSGLVLLVTAVGVIGDRPVHAAIAAPVKVVNGPADPVPVRGIVDAHINNATIPVSGQVSVSSLPALSLSNTSSTPLFVDEGNTARAAVGAQCDFDFVADTSTQCQIAAVPDGQILVIETVTCAASAPTGTVMPPIVLSMGATPIGGGAAINLNHRLFLTRTAEPGTAIGLDYYGLTTPVRMYAAANTGVWVSAGMGPIPGNVRPDLACAISGHLVNQ